MTTTPFPQSAEEWDRELWLHSNVSKEFTLNFIKRIQNAQIERCADKVRKLGDDFTADAILALKEPVS